MNLDEYARNAAQSLRDEVRSTDSEVPSLAPARRKRRLVALSGAMALVMALVAVQVLRPSPDGNAVRTIDAAARPDGKGNQTVPTRPTTPLPPCPKNFNAAQHDPNCAVGANEEGPAIVAAGDELGRKKAAGEIPRADLYGFTGTYFTEKVTGGQPSVLESSVLAAGATSVVYALVRNEHNVAAQLGGVATIQHADGSTSDVELSSMVPNARPGEPVPLAGEFDGSGADTIVTVTASYLSQGRSALEVSRNWEAYETQPDPAGTGQFSGVLFNNTGSPATPTVVLALRSEATGSLRVFAAELVADEYRGADGTVVVPPGAGIGFRADVPPDVLSSLTADVVAQDLLLWVSS